MAGDTLAEVAREYILAEAVIDRLSRRVDARCCTPCYAGWRSISSGAEAAARGPVLGAALESEG